MREAHIDAQIACFIFINFQLIVLNGQLNVGLFQATLLRSHLAQRSFSAIQHWLSCFSHTPLSLISSSFRLNFYASFSNLSRLTTRHEWLHCTNVTSTT